MARDPPPSLDHSPNLRDLQLQPSSIIKARPTIIHPQLRDLILPLERGRILYPRGNSIEELTFSHDDGSDGSEMEMEMEKDQTTPTSVRESSRTLFKLNFTPNCLVANKTILATGGQHGELYITNLPSSSYDRFTKPLKPFAISQTLQTRSINNSMILLPSYPTEWARQSERRKVGFKPNHVVREETMDLDERDEEDGEEEEDEDEVLEPSSPLTYPNTVPFSRGPRMSISPRPVEMDQMSRGGSSRRTVSFSDRDPDPLPRSVRVTRQSFSIPRPGLPPIEYVTSRNIPIDGPDTDPRIRPGKASSKRPTSWSEHIDEPRLLISNNDLSIKMFSLRPVSPTTTTQSLAYQVQSTTPFAPWRSHMPLPMPIPRARHTGLGDDELVYRDSVRHQRLEGDGVWMRAGDGHAVHRAQTPQPAPVPLPRDGEERKLVRLGMTQFKCAINHSSLSPDLKNMVCVGDSEDVHLFEVIDGGRDFQKVTTYKGATDSGFSTAWSRDGRKFAVAAQDGQVTVWDHRSSKPLAKFYSSQTSGPPSTPIRGTRPRLPDPSFTNDLLDAVNGTGIGRAPLLVDPVTGDARLGASTSGREAARVVKFSPEGEGRDLLVFSEENTNIHIIDAQTLNTHIVLPVPYTTPGQSQGVYRTGLEGGTWGIAGIAFDPTGQWLYSGTEGSVVEWDLRREGVGQGVWDLA